LKIETTAVVLDSAHFECLPIKPGLRTTKLEDHDNAQSIYRTFRYSDSTIFLQQFYKKDHAISNLPVPFRDDIVSCVF